MQKFARGVSLAAVLALAVPAAASAADWDQKEVAELVGQLVPDVAKIKEGIAEQWEKADKNSVLYVVLDDLMTLQHQVIALQGLVRAGEGREATLPVYRRILARVGHARHDAAAIPEIAAQRKHLAAAQKTLGKLSAYYTPAPKLLPPLPPPVKEPEPEDAPSPTS